jgi:hypothetical protein
MGREPSNPRAVVLLEIARPVDRSPANDNARPWRCRGCGSLLGLERGRALHVKYKDVEYWIVGGCRHVCRRCGEGNEITVGNANTQEDS